MSYVATLHHVNHGRHYDRPLYGPNAHPFLVAVRKAWRELMAVPLRQRPAKHAELIADLTLTHGAQFAGVIDFSLRERTAQITQRRYGLHQWCKRGHSLAPGSEHLTVRPNGTRYCGTCHLARVREVKARRANGLT